MILPRAARDHVPRHRLADVEDAGDIGAQQLLPVVGREILERRAELHAGIVDQDVDRPDFGLDRGRRRPRRPRGR